MGQYVPLNPPPLAQRGSRNVWEMNNYQSLSGALNVWHVIHQTTTSPFPQKENCQLSDIQVPNLCLVNIGNYCEDTCLRFLTPARNRIRHLSFARQVRSHYTTGPQSNVPACKWTAKLCLKSRTVLCYISCTRSA